MWIAGKIPLNHSGQYTYSNRMQKALSSLTGLGCYLPRYPGLTRLGYYLPPLSGLVRLNFEQILISLSELYCG
jgi:hypothetical protein